MPPEVCPEDRSGIHFGTYLVPNRYDELAPAYWPLLVVPGISDPAPCFEAEKGCFEVILALFGLKYDPKYDPFEGWSSTSIVIGSWRALPK